MTISLAFRRKRKSLDIILSTNATKGNELVDRAPIKFTASGDGWSLVWIVSHSNLEDSKKSWERIATLCFQLHQQCGVESWQMVAEGDDHNLTLRSLLKQLRGSIGFLLKGKQCPTKLLNV